MTENGIVKLRPGREKSVLRKHPWIFPGSIDEIRGDPGPGDTVQILSSAGQYLATGAYSPSSKIRVRIWTHEEPAIIDRDFIKGRIHRAIEGRNQGRLLDADHTAARLIFAEADGLPGLIADRYSDHLVVQVLAAGVERWKAVIVEELAAATGLSHIYERSDADVRTLEGLQPESGPLLGPVPAGIVEILEDGLRYVVDIIGGHKTGFYLDQRLNRAKLRTLAHGREVLNCFAYSGGFSISALAGGAKQVTSIESSPDAIRLGSENLEINGLADGRHTWIAGDVFSELRTLRDRASSFDLIVLDPPKFAATRSQAEGAARGYKDINLLAFKLLRPGGTLVTFSCSGGISADLFQKIVAGAALDAGATAQIIERLSQSPDHPTALHFPESEYLKGLVIRKTD